MTDIEEILNLAGAQLEDITHITWDDDTILFPYLNLGILEIIILKPDAYAQTKNLSLVTGSKQSIGSTDINILDVICNMGTDGTTVGLPINFIQKEKLELLIPDWLSYSGLGTSDIVVFVIHDTRYPRDFYVFPPQLTSNRKIRAVLSVKPDWIDSIDDTFPLDVTYKPALVDYIVYRTLAEETTIPNALQKSKDFQNKFMQDLGLKTNVEKQIEMKETEGSKP